MGNQPTLFDALDALNREGAPVAWTGTERNRGRTETRTIKVLAVPDHLGFPHAQQAVLIERTTTGCGDGKIHCYAEPGITSAPKVIAGASDLARITRDHWGGEAMHHVRDVTYDEDASRVRTGGAPRAMDNRVRMRVERALHSWGDVRCVSGLGALLARSARHV